jgi:hypothetical protein
MAAMAISDEQLMAYADGVLTPEEAAEVERAMAEDEALAEKVALFADSRSAVKRAFGTAPAVPEALADKVRALAEADAARRAAPPASNVVDLAARRRSVPIWQLPAAAAAALVLGVGLGGALFQPRPGDPAEALAIAGLGDPGIVEALGTVASGERVALGDAGEFEAIATFRDGEGTLCREFDYDPAGGGTMVAVACRGGAAWDVRFVVTAAADDAQGYEPASSLDTLEGYHAAIGSGAPLSPEEERAALEALR